MPLGTGIDSLGDFRRRHTPFLQQSNIGGHLHELAPRLVALGDIPVHNRRRHLDLPVRPEYLRSTVQLRRVGDPACEDEDKPPGAAVVHGACSNRRFRVTAGAPRPLKDQCPISTSAAVAATDTHTESCGPSSTRAPPWRVRVNSTTAPAEGSSIGASDHRQPHGAPRSATEPKAAAVESQILRTAEVLVATGLGRTTLWRRVKSGDFPAPIRLGGAGSRAVGWRRTEIQAWIDERPRAA